MLTADNASNKGKLAASLQQTLSDGDIIARIPCLAYVIRLSINQLLDQIKAISLSDAAETEWAEKQSRLARKNAKQAYHQISTTLNAVRYVAV